MTKVFEFQFCSIINSIFSGSPESEMNFLHLSILMKGCFMRMRGRSRKQISIFLSFSLDKRSYSFFFFIAPLFHGDFKCISFVWLMDVGYNFSLLLTAVLESSFENLVSIGTGVILLFAAWLMRTPNQNLSVGDLALFIYYLSY